MMLLLCFALFTIAITVWASAPLFCGSGQIRYGTWLWVLLPFVMGTLFLYALFGHERAWHNWQQQGRAHYELMNQVQQLGGLPGLIQGVKARLAQNPNDITGWQLLAKLYEANHQPQQAKEALMQVERLQQSVSSGR